jgi:tetratricopeptide (TPR) repeat protein
MREQEGRLGTVDYLKQRLAEMRFQREMREKGILERGVKAPIFHKTTITDIFGKVDKPDAYQRLGNLYERYGRYKQAVSAYQAAAELEPGHVYANERISDAIARAQSRYANQVIESENPEYREAERYLNTMRTSSTGISYEPALDRLEAARQAESQRLQQEAQAAQSLEQQMNNYRQQIDYNKRTIDTFIRRRMTNRALVEKAREQLGDEAAEILLAEI